MSSHCGGSFFITKSMLDNKKAPYGMTWQGYLQNEQRKIHRWRGMRQRADGNIIDTGRGNVSDVFQAYIARSFQLCSASDELHDALHFSNRHVIQHNMFDVVAQAFFHIGKRSRFNFQIPIAPLPLVKFAALPNGVCDATRSSYMILLNQKHIVQSETMVEPAAALHGIFFQDAPAGRGFARVENFSFGSGNGIDEFSRQRRDAGKALEKIQRDALAGENGSERAAKTRDVLFRAEIIFVGH